LAPAGSHESFAAALASGADAVYLGLAEGFNARGRSTAFRLEDLPSLVHRAHRAKVKLYLTLNTLIFESELELLERVLEGVIRSGVDALIIQDPATALLAGRLSNEVRLHASTQMTVSSAEGAQFAATLGIERVVLPRELSAHEIALFTRDSDLEAEVFVHGALCMAWSGQCLTSEAFSERSANRGQCSQACRMPYDAIVDGKKLDTGDVRYLLSPQDLAAHEALPQLIEAGIASLKIEGRYKGPAYVATAVDSWSHWREAVLRGVTDQDRVRLEADVLRTQLTFSRGGSIGFLKGDNHQELVVGDSPKHRGLALGTVKRVQGQRVEVTLNANLSASTRKLIRPGSGVKFELVGRGAAEREPENAPGGPIFGVRFIEGPHGNGGRGGGEALELTFGRPGPDLSRVRSLDEVRLTGDPEIGRDTERRLLKAPLGRIPLELRVSGSAGQRLVVEAQAEGVRRLGARVATRAALALCDTGDGLGAPLLEDKLGALGGTPFFLAHLSAEQVGPGLHIPVSELKQLRRELVSALESELEEAPVLSHEGGSVAELRAELTRSNSERGGVPALVPLCRTEEQLEAVIAAGLPLGSEVELDWMEMVGLTRAVARAKGAGLRVTLATVRVQKPGEEAYDRRIAGLKPDGVLARHWGAVMHFSEGTRRGDDQQRDDEQEANRTTQAQRATSAESPGGPRLALHGDFSLNVTNSITALHLLKFGLETVTASHDLNREQLLDLLLRVPRGRVAVTLHHHISTFHNSHCVYAHLLSDGADYRSCGRPCEEHRLALADYAGHQHPVVVDVSCRNTVFNAQAQSAAPLVPKLLELGVRRYRVEFVWESGEEVARTLAAYQKLLRGEISAATALLAARVHERYGLTTLRGGKR